MVKGTTKRTFVISTSNAFVATKTDTVLACPTTLKHIRNRVYITYITETIYLCGLEPILVNVKRIVPQKL